jgi:hypothetical protein
MVVAVFMTARLAARAAVGVIMVSIVGIMHKNNDGRIKCVSWCLVEAESPLRQSSAKLFPNAKLLK